MPRKTLRAVAPDERPQKPATIAEAATRSELSLLVALRDKIIADLDRGVPPHTLAPLTRQVRDLERDIQQLSRGSEDRVGDAAAIPDEKFDPKAL